MSLGKNERIVTAWAGPTKGPGWANWPIWVLVQRKGGDDYRVLCLQPDKHTAELTALYDVSAAAHKSMTALVEAIFREEEVAREAAHCP